MKKKSSSFEITKDGMVISPNGAPMSKIFFAYLKVKASTIVFVIVMAVLFVCYIGAGYVTLFSTFSTMGMGVFVLLSIILFWSLNKRPKKT
ncbi:hypothetical protein A3B84_02215 [Candidatus Nomurabacteria bacterium RIFCSPHIGHO2_02_FULL_35_13]|uniref:Uncharacterized protein n=1 Tax=Candidatus Nomurabacteria bacterium RIFCSPHIGHO2_02_FULL_35_13 TaxID=1801748 RepID=A0A1F6VMX4_9BACT|nr:MAG: hypothetical protein A3B84_02215 [Candidatus Nomurabacteria bacterium RIFCSPHIGHO2_02_FULL_35_13]